MKPFLAFLGLGIALVPLFALAQGVPSVTTVKDILNKPLPQPPAEILSRIGEFLGRAWGFVAGIVSWQDVWNFLRNLTLQAIAEGKNSFEKGWELIRKLFNLATSG